MAEAPRQIEGGGFRQSCRPVMACDSLRMAQGNDEPQYQLRQTGRYNSAGCKRDYW